MVDIMSGLHSDDGAAQSCPETVEFPYIRENVKTHIRPYPYDKWLIFDSGIIIASD